MHYIEPITENEENLEVLQVCISFNCQIHWPFPTYRRILTHLQLTTFENVVTTGEIAQYEQFLLLPLCFHFFSVNTPTIIDIFHILSTHFQSCLLQICCIWERVNRFQNTTQCAANVNIWTKTWKRSLILNILLLNRFKNVVAKVICCRCIKMCLDVERGIKISSIITLVMSIKRQR